MKHLRPLPLVVLLAAVAFATAPLFVPFDGLGTHTFPVSQHNPPAVPAAYAFAIWIPIYLWLVASALFGIVKRPDDPQWNRARTPLLPALVLGAFWLSVSAQRPVAALIMIWAMLVLALVALARSPDRDQRWLRSPLALFAGWLVAASWTALSVIGGGYGLLFDGIGWAIVAVLGTILTVWGVVRRIGPLPEFALPVAWALVAVAVKDTQTQPLVATVAGLGAIGAGILPFITSDDSFETQNSRN